MPVNVCPMPVKAFAIIGALWIALALTLTGLGVYIAWRRRHDRFAPSDVAARFAEGRPE